MLAEARCPDCQQDLERGERERYTCAQCGRAWVRIGGMYAADDPFPPARVVDGARGSACCGADLVDAGWEKSACRACGKRYVRVGIQLVPE